MSVGPGSTIGVYRVVSKLGEGGPPPLAGTARASFGEIHRSQERTAC